MELQRVLANKKPLFQVQPIVFEQQPFVLSIVLYENRDLFLIQGGFLFAGTRCNEKRKERRKLCHITFKSFFR